MTHSKGSSRKPQRAQITIADVAEAAGVSVSTVSRIINDKPDVSDETRERVEQVIEELGYRPHAVARRLAAGKTHTITLLYPFEQPGSLVELDFIVGAATAAGEEGYLLNLMTNPVTERGLLGLFQSAEVDGVILLQVHLQDRRVDILREHGYPFVMIGRCADNTGLSFLDLDFEKTIPMVFDYLVELGHRSIGFLNYPPSGASYVTDGDYGPAVRAQAAYEGAIQKHGLAPICQQVDFTAEDVTRATLELLDDEPELTAIFIADGARASGVIKALNQRGRVVPTDFSVVGVATERMAELISPPLTTSDFPSYMMGYQAGKILVSRVEKESLDVEQILIPPELIVRSSTGPAKEWLGDATVQVPSDGQRVVEERR
jgi:DNA-binding LacI/PurR family transcriptional regulator